MLIIENITSAQMKKYRLWLNLTQGELAAKFGVSTNTYARWERGDQVPESNELIALAFESLLNRKITIEKETIANKKSRKILDETRAILADIDRLQKIRVMSHR